MSDSDLEIIVPCVKARRRKRREHTDDNMIHIVPAKAAKVEPAHRPQDWHDRTVGVSPQDHAADRSSPLKNHPGEGDRAAAETMNPFSSFAFGGQALSASQSATTQGEKAANLTEMVLSWEKGARLTRMAQREGGKKFIFMMDSHMQFPDTRDMFSAWLSADLVL